MFEKEAEKYREEWQSKGYYFVSQEMEQIELDDIVDATFKDGAEFGYNKANEWHYVKNGDLPKSKNKVLVLLKDVEEPILDYYRQDGLWNYALEDEVIAWKEIVLPELPKESE